MNNNLSLIHRPTSFRVWVWIPVLVLFGAPMIAAPNATNLTIGGLIIAGVAVYEFRNSRRGIWETDTELVVVNRGERHHFDKSTAKLWVGDGGEYAWIGWKAADRPALDNSTKLPRLYLAGSDGEKVRIEAALGLNRPKVHALAERIDASLVA